MSKTLLSLSAMLLASASAFGALPQVMAPQLPPVAATRADGSMYFSYASQPWSALYMNDTKMGDYFYACFKLDDEDVKLLAGNKITDISVRTGSGSQQLADVTDKDITLFITDDLRKLPSYTQDVTLDPKAFAENTFNLTTPYEISANEGLYIGYRIKLTALTEYYFVVDGIATSKEACIIGFTSEEHSMPDVLENMSPYYGALCMGITVTGDNLPYNNVTLTSAEGPLSVKIGQNPSADIVLRNVGANAVKNVELKIDATGEESYTKNVSFEKGLNSCQSATGTVTLNPFTKSGAKDIRFTVTKVDGEENTNPDASLTISTVAFDKGFSRMPVVEEGTGTWCGFCPGGIVMMEHLKAKYNDKVALIAVHGGNDPMVVSDYSTWISAYLSGYPTIVLNRRYAGNPNSIGELGWDTTIDEMLASEIFANIELGEMTYDEASNSADFKANIEFGVNTDKNYKVSLAIVEDGLGPFKQSNYFAGYQSGYPGDWNEKPHEYRMVYDDVARVLSSFPGDDVNNGASITSGTPMEHSFHVSLANVSKDNFRAIAILADGVTGEVINADMISTSKSGIRGVAADKNVNIAAGKGSINVNGAANVAVYNMSGVKVANGNVSNLPAGIYIVKADNTVRKVVVR